MAVTTDPPTAFLQKVIRRVKNAVAQIRLGTWAKSRHGIAFCQTKCFVVIQVGGVHETPASVDLHVFEQPGYRSLMAPRQTIIDFLQLFGGVDVNRRGTVMRIHVCNECFQLLRRHRTQGVWCDANAAHYGLMFEDAFHQRIECVDTVDEALLARIGRCTAEGGVRVKHRQHGKTDSGSDGGGNDALGHLGAIRIRIALLIVMQVVKFGNTGIARFEHLDIKLRGDGLIVFGCDALKKPVHQLAPCPEIIATRPRSLGEAGHGALKCMRVQIGHARNDRSVGNLCIVWNGIGRDTNDQVAVDFYQDIATPAID